MTGTDAMKGAGSRSIAATPPLISIVIACYNPGAIVATAIESVLDQLGDDAELVVIDGGSDEATCAVLGRYRDRLAYLISEPDRGIYDAWNKGIRAARGRYIGFLGADDVYLPGALAAYRALIAAAPDAEYLSSRVRYGSGARARIIGRPWRWARFRRYMTVAHVGSLHRRSLFDRCGLYDDSFAITGDYELLLRTGATLRTAFMADITVEMGTGGISSGRSKRVFAEASRAKALHSGLPALVIAADRARATIGFRARRLLRR